VRAAALTERGAAEGTGEAALQDEDVAFGRGDGAIVPRFPRWGEEEGLSTWIR